MRFQQSLGQRSAAAHGRAAVATLSSSTTGARSLAPPRRTRAVAPSYAASVSAATAYEEFAAKASGEWEGITATFSSDGSVEQLPEYYVPDAYRDWGVEVNDWQTHCSTLAVETGVQLTLKRLMPTVGCEADAVAFQEETAHMFQDLLSRSQPAPVLADGSYSHGPQVVAEGDNKLVVDACFAGQGAGRVRLVQHLVKGLQDGRWATSKVEVHNEKYDAPYNAGYDIRSCGYIMENIGLSARATAEQLGGSWGEAAGTRYLVTHGDASGPTVAVEAITGGSLLPVQAEPMALPLGAWSALTESEGSLWAAAGVLSPDGASRVVIARQYVEGKLVEVILGSESRSPAS